MDKLKYFVELKERGFNTIITGSYGSLAINQNEDGGVDPVGGRFSIPVDLHGVDIDKASIKIDEIIGELGGDKNEQGTSDVVSMVECEALDIKTLAKAMAFDVIRGEIDNVNIENFKSYVKGVVCAFDFLMKSSFGEELNE